MDKPLDTGRRRFLKKLGILGIAAAIAGIVKDIPLVHAPGSAAPTIGWNETSGSKMVIGQVIGIDSSGPTYVLRDGYSGNITTETTASAILGDAITNA